MSDKSKGGRDNFGHNDLGPGEVTMPIVILYRNVVFPGGTIGQESTYSPKTNVDVDKSFELLEKCHKLELPVAALCMMSESAVPINNFFHTVTICQMTSFSAQVLPNGDRQVSLEMLAVGRGELLELLPHKGSKKGSKNAALAVVEVLLEPAIDAEEWENPMILLARKSIIAALEALLPLAKKFLAENKSAFSEEIILKANAFIALLTGLPAKMEASDGPGEFLEHLESLAAMASLEIKLSFFEALAVESRINCMLQFIGSLIAKYEEYFYNKSQLAGKTSSVDMPKAEIEELFGRAAALLDGLNKLRDKGGSDGSGQSA